MSRDTAALVKQVWAGDENAAAVLADYVMEHLRTSERIKVTGTPVSRRKKEGGLGVATVAVIFGTDGDNTGRITVQIEVTQGPYARPELEKRVSFTPEMMAEKFPKWLLTRLMLLKARFAGTG